ncbi:MAG: DUF4145 domain-containing protein [Xanthobacteraceae bacterium]|jgi:hypothetical protein
MVTKYKPKNLSVIFRKLERENARAVISVAASLIEYALEQVIMTRLRKPRDDSEQKELFNENGILGTFSEKISAAYFLKIIGPKARRELDLIRRIRNQAAHDMNPISFDRTEEIAARCRELSFGSEAVANGIVPSKPRHKFLAITRFFAANLLMRSGDNTAEIPQAFGQLAPSLDN